MLEGRAQGGPLWEGWLWKAGQKNKEWKRRYFRLQRRALVYSEDERSTARRPIDLESSRGVCWLDTKFIILSDSRTWLLEFVDADDRSRLGPRLEQFVPLATVSLSGYLNKRAMFKRWHRRFFLLLSIGHILRFMDSELTRLVDSTDLRLATDAQIRKIPDAPSPLCLVIIGAHGSQLLAVCEMAPDGDDLPSNANPSIRRWHALCREHAQRSDQVASASHIIRHGDFRHTRATWRTVVEGVSGRDRAPLWMGFSEAAHDQRHTPPEGQYAHLVQRLRREVVPQAPDVHVDADRLLGQGTTASAALQQVLGAMLLAYPDTLYTHSLAAIACVVRRRASPSDSFWIMRALVARRCVQYFRASDGLLLSQVDAHVVETTVRIALLAPRIAAGHGASARRGNEDGGARGPGKPTPASNDAPSPPPAPSPAQVSARGHGTGSAARAHSGDAAPEPASPAQSSPTPAHGHAHVHTPAAAPAPTPAHVSGPGPGASPLHDGVLSGVSLWPAVFQWLHSLFASESAEMCERALDVTLYRGKSFLVRVAASALLLCAEMQASGRALPPPDQARQWGWNGDSPDNQRTGTCVDWLPHLSPQRIVLTADPERSPSAQTLDAAVASVTSHWWRLVHRCAIAARDDAGEMEALLMDCAFQVEAAAKAAEGAREAVEGKEAVGESGGRQQATALARALWTRAADTMRTLGAFATACKTRADRVAAGAELRSRARGRQFVRAGLIGPLALAPPTPPLCSMHATLRACIWDLVACTGQAEAEAEATAMRGGTWATVTAAEAAGKNVPHTSPAGAAARARAVLKRLQNSLDALATQCRVRKGRREGHGVERHAAKAVAALDTELADRNRAPKGTAAAVGTRDRFQSAVLQLFPVLLAVPRLASTLCDHLPDPGLAPA